MKKSFGLSFLFLFLILFCKGQDYVFSQFYNTPIYLNPALTGKINSTWRVIANYRNQYTQVATPAPFTSFGFSFDAGILREALDNDIFGVGVLFINDNQGGFLKTQHIMISSAYHKGLGYKKDHYLSAGFQFDMVHRSININALQFEDQFDGTGFTFPTLEEIDQQSIWYPNLNAGLFWSSFFSERFSAFGGASLHNILTPKESFLTNSSGDRTRRYSSSAGVVVDINKVVLISPNGLFFKQGPAQSIIAGSSFGFNLSGVRRPYETTLYVGGWYNLNGAIIGSTGIQFKGFQFGLSYDNNIGDITNAAKSFGAIEISIIFVDKPVERKKTYQLLHCPKF